MCVCVWLVRICAWFGASHILTPPHTQAHAHTHKRTDNRTCTPPPHTPTCTWWNEAALPPHAHPHPHPHTAQPHIRTHTCIVDVSWLGMWGGFIVGVSMCVCVCVCARVCGLVCARGCVFVCGCVSMGPWLCMWVCGCWCEVWDGFVCVCGRVAPTSPHTPTHRRMPARRNKQEVMHPATCKRNHTPIHKPTQIHTPHTKAHPHTCAHVARSQGACRGALGGGTPGVSTNEGVHKAEICMNSREFT